MIRYLSDYIDQELDEAIREEARRHLDECDNCRVVLDTTQKTILLYRSECRASIPITRRGPIFERLKKAIEETENI
jgi:anti-sigma factor RsiW